SGAGDCPRRAHVRFRPLHARRRHASLQAAMGRSRRAAPVGAVVAARYPRDAVARAPGVSGRRGSMEAAADVRDESVGPAAREAPPVRQPPVHPPLPSPELDSLTAALTAGARLVVVTSLYGVPVQWRAVLECAAAVGAAVIEDAAQGFGASWLGRPLGSLGAVSVLSFGRGKGWTGGRGGALLARG